MTTKLDKTIKREIELDGSAYMVAVSPSGVKLTQKGFRKGREMSWRQLWEGGGEEKPSGPSAGSKLGSAINADPTPGGGGGGITGESARGGGGLPTTEH